MKKMKAVVKPNAQSNNFILMEVPIPTIKEDEVLVRVKAIGVGIQDRYFFSPNMQFPYPIGIEGAGIIKETGEKVTDLQTGDKVAFISMLEPKDILFIAGASGANGTFVVQLAKEKGCIVSASTSQKNHAYIEIFEGR